MSVTITRESYPHLWSVFALVSSTMGQSPADQVVDLDAIEVRSYEFEISSWDLSDVLVLAGVVTDDDAFDVLLMTEVGSFVNHVLVLPG